MSNVGRGVDDARLSTPGLLNVARAAHILPGGDDHLRLRREKMDQRPDASAETCRRTDLLAASGTIESTEIEELEAMMSPWDSRYHQLSKGRLNARIHYLKLPGMLLYESHWQSAVRTHGIAPEGFVMFGTSLAWRRSRNYWCGRLLGPQRFACAGPGSDFCHTSPDRSHHAVVLVSEALLAVAVGVEALDFVRRGKHLECSAQPGERLNAAMTGVVQMFNRRPALMNDAHEVARARSRLLESLAGCLNHTPTQNRQETVATREACVHRALEYVDRSSWPITALEMARAVGVSQRTLEHGFRGLLGVTPAAYLRIDRLNRVHHGLAQAAPGSLSVTDAALRWGFSHAGRFSVAYREMFDESPSLTLARPSKT